MHAGVMSLYSLYTQGLSVIQVSVHNGNFLHGSLHKGCAQQGFHHEAMSGGDLLSQSDYEMIFLSFVCCCS